MSKRWNRIETWLALGVMLALALTILVTMNRRLRELLVGAERIGRGEGLGHQPASRSVGPAAVSTISGCSAAGMSSLRIT